MSIGLLALLDDVAAMVKMSAVSLDDISAQVAKTSSKVSGIVIDDAAVTPKYVVGLDPKRELNIIYHIAKKSIFNKIIYLTPLAITLGYFLPWLIQPILMCGGAYLCFEGYEKVHSMFAKHEDMDEDDIEKMEHITPETLEKLRIESAVRTDFILSGEIIAITYANVADKPLLMQLVVMVLVAIGITISVYGFVGLVVKMDDIGLHFAKGNYPKPLPHFGRALVLFMPRFLQILGYIGTAAMLWVGAEIIAHGIAPIHHALEAVAASIAQPALAWGSKALLCAIGGVGIGAVIAKILNGISTLRTPKTST